MKSPDMAKENNFVLREAAKAAQMGYYDHLAAGGKGDPAEERWIEALMAGADAITQVAVLESRLAKVERERDAAINDCGRFPCETCKERENGDLCPMCVVKGSYRSLHQWRGVCTENAKEDTTDEPT